MSIKPSEKEEEYFARLDLELRKKYEAENLKRIEEEEKRTLAALHFMRCPKCGMQLAEVDHHSVKIDRCFSCEGVWLDAGELEMIGKMEKSAFDKLFAVFGK
jgi:hypothetical protein